MRMLSLIILAAFASGTPAWAGKDDGVKAEDARRVMAQSCRMQTLYHPGCMGGVEPTTTATTATPQALPRR